MAILLILPPFFLGVINKVKAISVGKKGPPIFQNYYDLIKLLRKESVLSNTSTFIIRIAPVLILASIIFAGLILPIVGGPPIHFEGDLILFAYFFAVARFFTILAAMDVGSSFEAMGASREAAFGAFSELAFFMSLIALSVMTNSISLSSISIWREAHTSLQPALLLLFIVFFLILLTENSRMPIDDPNTHLELTMIHEVMILDYSGPELGIVLYGASIKIFLFMVLTVSTLWPVSPELGVLSFVEFFGKLLAMSVLVGIVESVTARIRLIRLPQLLIANFVIAALALLVTFFGKGL